MFSAAKTAGPFGYKISRSVRLRSSASAYFSRTPASAATSGTKFTWSAWVKRGSVSATYSCLFAADAGGGTAQLCYFDSTGILYFATGASTQKTSAAVFRDPSAWYHIVVVGDTTQATASNRLQFYVNGVQQTWTSGTDPSLNGIWQINKQSTLQGVGFAVGSVASTYFDGYMTEINMIDGQALTPSSFGSTNAITGVWQPAKYTGTYGTNGFYLNFSDNSAATAAAIGKDYSGNGNNWTPNNISVTAGTTYDSMLDVPTPYADGGNGRGNYAVLNPLTTTAGTYSNANLRYVGASAWRRSNGSISVTSGKWYWEVTLGNAPFSPRGSTTSYNAFGFGLASVFNSTTQSSSATDGVYLADNGYYKNFSGAWTDGGVAFSSGDVLAVAVDLGANTFTFYRNNTQVVTGTIGVTAGTELAPIILSYDGTYGVMDCNFGQRPFTYTPPSGFKALNTYNLPASTILNGGKYMAATTYTGTGAIQNITNAGSFKPDLVWIKSRSTVGDTEAYDSVRGATKYLLTDSTVAEGTIAQSLTAFNSNGFALGTGSGGNDNTNGTTYIGWQWQAGQGSTSSNASGTITSTVSVNATAGFSVVSYTANGAAAQTIGHGLGVTPSMVVTKCRSAGASNWGVYHRSIGNTGALFLNTTNATATSSLYWNNTSPTSSVFSVGTNNTDTNFNTNTMVAYCWAEIAGFSKFGSYTGNGSTDGPFVYCGFRPRYILVKNASAATDWQVRDTSRDPYNIADHVLYPNGSYAETSADGRNIDILSNGFKVRWTGSTDNGSGNTIIYAAFAENPFANALAR